MWLKELKLAGYRNLKDCAIAFDSNSNFLFGPNGAGKTNLLEAIYYLGTGRSFIPFAKDSEIVRFGADFFRISGDAVLNQNGLKETGEIRYEIRSQKKSFFIREKEIPKLSQYFGWLLVVPILLDDIGLIRDAPKNRRSFLDLTIAQTDRSYLKNLIEYRKILLQRNHLLQKSAPDEMFAPWEVELARIGKAILLKRHSVVERIFSEAKRFYSLFFLPTEDESLEIEFSYLATVDIGEETDTQEKFLSLLSANREREKVLGRTLTGPHRDEILIRRSGLPLKLYGSSGEQRIAALALRLGAATFLKEERDEKPIFLLDEIASELDKMKTERLFTILKEIGQIFYSASKEFHCEGKIFHLEKGEIREG